MAASCRPQVVLSCARVSPVGGELRDPAAPDPAVGEAATTAVRRVSRRPAMPRGAARTCTCAALVVLPGPV